MTQPQPGGAAAAAAMLPVPIPAPGATPPAATIQPSASAAGAPASIGQTYRVHLHGKGLSGRAVQYRILDPDEIDHIEAQGVQSIEVPSSGELSPTLKVKMGNATSDLGAKMMIVGVSDPVTPDKLGDVRFKVLSREEIDLNWGKYFNTRDTRVLRRLFNEEHDVSAKDIETIFSGKVPLAG